MSKHHPEGAPRGMSDVLPSSDEARGILRTFPLLVSKLEEGMFGNECTDKMTDLVAALSDAVETNGGAPAGTMTVKFAFVLKDGAFEITASVATTAPKVKRRRTILYATPNNQLSIMHPRQTALDLREVGGGQVAAREA